MVFWNIHGITACVLMSMKPKASSHQRAVHSHINKATSLSALVKLRYSHLIPWEIRILWWFGAFQRDWLVKRKKVQTGTLVINLFNYLRYLFYHCCCIRYISRLYCANWRGFANKRRKISVVTSVSVTKAYHKLLIMIILPKCLSWSS